MKGLRNNMKQYFDKLYNKSFSEMETQITNNLLKNKKMFIVTANPETLMIASKNKNFSDLLLDADTTIVPDGIGIVKAAKILDYDICERITGIDLAQKLIEIGNDKHKSIYLFGSTQEVIDKTKQILTGKYPNLIILGAQNGYIASKDEEFKVILKKQPDIVLVALGIPTQEELIYRHYSDFKKGIFIGVGGSLDVISGSKKRAPQIFIKLNLEWLYRLCKEPKRIKRFYDNNIKFLIKVYRLK